MKKLLLFLLILTSGNFGFSQITPIITMIMDGDCTGGTPKVLEIYAQGTVDFTQYSLENQTNGGTTWGNTFDLSPLGTVTNDFVYVVSEGSNAGVFASEFPSVPVANTLITTSSVVNFNGNDRIRIIETATTTVIDQFGVDSQDGTGTYWEYKDGYAKRVDNTGPDGATFTQANWTFNNGGVNGQGLCQGGTAYGTLTNAGSFTFSTSPTVASSEDPVTGFIQFVGTPSNPDSVDITGINLTADVNVAVANGDYEVSLTKNSGYSTSLVIPQTGGSAASKVYIRLNGAAAANPSNGYLVLTSTGATNDTVHLEGVIQNPAPSVVISTDTITTFFSQFVGTPSVADSFDVQGYYLTNDITIDAPANFELSLDNSTFTSSLTLTPASGTVANTRIYVRLNGAAMNLNQVGLVMLNSTGATSDSVFVNGQTLDYIVADIDTLKTVDANGVNAHVGQYVSVTGTVYCEDFRSYPGYDLTVIDGTGAGIDIFSSDDIIAYQSTEGDKIEVRGIIDQYNGLTELKADTIILISQSNPLNAPTVVSSAFDESIESQFIEIDNLTTVNGETAWPDGGNIDVTDGVNTYSVRVPSGTSLANAPIPNYFKIIGTGRQFDNSSPYTSGYQIFPCSVTDLCNISVTATENAGDITASVTAGIPPYAYQWKNCADSSDVAGATGATFSPAQSGDYFVVVTDNGACTSSSTCVTVDLSAVSKEDFAGTKIYPNPVKDQLQISTNNTIQSVVITAINGRVVYAANVDSNNVSINTKKLSAGVYFVKLRSNNSEKTFKVIK